MTVIQTGEGHTMIEVGEQSTEQGRCTDCGEVFKLGDAPVMLCWYVCPFCLKGDLTEVMG